MPSLYGVGNYGEKVYSGPNPVDASVLTSMPFATDNNAYVEYSADAAAGLVMAVYSEAHALYGVEGQAALVMATEQPHARLIVSPRGLSMLTMSSEAVSWLVKVLYASSTTPLDFASSANSDMIIVAVAPVAELSFSALPFSPYSGSFWAKEAVGGSRTPKTVDQTIWTPENITPWSQ